MQASHISHISLGVSSLQRSYAFYRDALGMKVLFELREDMSSQTYLKLQKNRHAAKVVAGLSFSDNHLNPVLVLEEWPERPPDGNAILVDQIGISHISFSVPDVGALARDLLSKGIPALLPAEEAYRDSSQTIANAYYKDPDGVLVQFDQHRPDFWERMRDKAINQGWRGDMK